MAVERMTKTEGDKRKFEEGIKHINDQIAILREQLELEKSKVSYNENVDLEDRKSVV